MLTIFYSVKIKGIGGFAKEFTLHPIAPPTREPGVPSNGRLLIPDRMTRSRTTNDSSRQGADDGYREYTSMNQTFYNLPEDRRTCPISAHLA